MANTTRTLAAVIVMMAALAGAEHGAAAGPQTNTPVAHPVVGPAVAGVRALNPALAKLIRQATERSLTFRGLIDSIEASDGIVYVDEGECGRGVRA